MRGKCGCREGDEREVLCYTHFTPIIQQNLNMSEQVVEARATLERLQISRRRPDFTLPPMHEGLQLSPHTALSEASSEGGRVFCDTCNTSRRFFCHTCLTAFTTIPRVTLPCHVYFITDKKELLTKATGVQCALLAPDHVTLCRPHELPSLDPNTAVLLFPEEGASSVAELVTAAARKNKVSCVGTILLSPESDGDNNKVSSRLPYSPSESSSSPSSSTTATANHPQTRQLGQREWRDQPGAAALPSAVVIIDSKWNGAHLIASTPNLRHLPRVKLARYRTAFWRFHPQPKSQEKRDVRDRQLAEGKDDGDEKVCSVEALFFFMRELHCAMGVHADDEGKQDGDETEKDSDGVGEMKHGGDVVSTDQGRDGRVRGGGGGGAGRCHCFDDLLWYFAWQHQTVAARAATRDYHPIPPQMKKSARRRASLKAAPVENDTMKHNLRYSPS